MPEEVPARLGETYGERLLSQLGNAPSLVFDIVERHAIACEATRSGTLHCAVGVGGAIEIAERARQWLSRGADVVLLDDRQTREATGTNAYKASLLDRRAGTIQPLAYVRGLATAAIGLGAEVFTRSPAATIVSRPKGWRVATAQGSITAPVALIATDTYSTRVFPELRRELVRLPYFNLATAPLPTELQASILPGRHGAWDTRLVMSSFRLDAAGRLIFGSIGALRGSGAAIHRNWGRRALRRLFPQLASVAFEHEWFGWIGMTSDALPRFHRLGRNLYSISGYNGRGIAPGTAFGRDLARLAMGQVQPEELPLPLTDISFPAMRIPKEIAYEHGSQMVHALDARMNG
jgi:glycine/D-amino acid oxidase-like deaminating enzyme